MLALYKKSEQFLNNMKKMVGNSGTEVEKSVRARVEHFRSVLPSMAQDIEDSDGAMDALLQESDAFTLSQRQEFAKAITNHMSAKVATPSYGDTKLHTNKFLCNYVPETFWKKFMDPTIEWDEKLELGIQLLLMIRCRNPSDATYKALLSILATCHQRSLTPSEAHTNINALKVKMFHKRQLHPGEQALIDYPQDSAEFTRQFPNAYL